MNIKINLSFDGTLYHGWQRLKEDDNTIQGKIEDCLSKMAEKKIQVNGCGRTDRGVHAYNYCANFTVPENFEPEFIKKYLNAYLPKDINISSCEKTDERFHARLSVKKKTYVYRIWNSQEHNVFERKYLYEFPGTLDISKMEEAKEYLEGTHNFISFCSNKHYKKSPERTIYSIDIKNLNPEIQIEYTGDGFLYNMVRIMTGTLIEIGNGKRNIEDIKRIFESEKREEAGFTAPAKGLFLKGVIY